MWLTVLKGVFSGSFGIIGDYFKGKQELAKAELSIKQEIARTKNQIDLAQVTKQLDIDGERVEQMKNSWKDEWFTFLFSIPLVGLFLSPFFDLLLIGQYEAGMLGEAANTALANLDSAPSWYVIIVITMVMLSYGYRKGIDKILSVMNFGKNK